MQAHAREEKNNGLDYTQQAYEMIYETIEDPMFESQDQNAIYQALKERIQMVSFGDFLKRYIYEKAIMTGDYREIPIDEYQKIICDEFEERQTPASFEPTTSRIKNLAKNWLQQRTVNRSVVLLLGFGLGMTDKDVDDFLTKALKEQRLNAKNAQEVICWYCYRNGLSYIRFEQLLKEYHQREMSVDGGVQNERLNLDSTSVFKRRMLSIENEEQLKKYLLAIPSATGPAHQSVRARIQFEKLYEQTKTWVADVLTEMEESDALISAARLQEILSQDDRHYDYEKKKMIEKEKKRQRKYCASDISPAKVEQVIFASVPKDKHGNILPLKLSTLFSQFTGAKLNRQHIGDILEGRGQITRYDLITLNFLVLYQEIDKYHTVTERFNAFVESTNRILESSDMGPLYPVNPYESFLMMCILSDDPVGTFSDVWELSYFEKSEDSIPTPMDKRG